MIGSLPVRSALLTGALRPPKCGSAADVRRFGHDMPRRDILGTQFDVALDGQRFNFPSSKGEGSQPITVVLNWPAELGQK